MGESTRTEWPPKLFYDAIADDAPDHAPGTRPVHAVGIGAKGHFTASPVAPGFTAAEHFSGASVPVSIRFSNGSGSPTVRDGARDVRGMAVKFHLPSGAATDLISVTLPLFFAATPEQVLGFSRAGLPRPRGPLSFVQRLRDALTLRLPLPDAPGGADGLAGFVAYANRHAAVRPATVAALSAVTPVSYTRAAYHAVHAFKLVDADGVVRYARFSWEPVEGVRPRSELHPPDDYLREELRQRLGRGPARFVLRMTLAEQGDPVDDPTRWWDVTRRRIVMGELAVTDVADDQDADGERISFNPMRLVPGFESTDDPIIATRGAVYEYSCRQRGGRGCPVMGNGEPGR